MERAHAWLLGLALIGCGPSTGSTNDREFPTAPLLTIASESGHSRVDVFTAPEQPPSRGVHSIQFVIRDAATGALREGLTVDVVPWMTAMGHGGSVKPQVREVSPGAYVASNVNLFMPGTWNLRVTLSGPADDHVTPSFDVP